jgi:transposase
LANVETTIATTPDDAVTAQIHASLNQRDLLPDVHLTDMGYIDAELLVESERRYQLDLLGPVRGDYRRQGQEDKGFAAADFAIDWEAQQARCPAGCTSINRNPTIDLRESPVIIIVHQTIAMARSFDAIHSIMLHSSRYNCLLHATSCCFPTSRGDCASRSS